MTIHNCLRTGVNLQLKLAQHVILCRSYILCNEDLSVCLSVCLLRSYRDQAGWVGDMWEGLCRVGFVTCDSLKTGRVHHCGDNFKERPCAWGLWLARNWFAGLILFRMGDAEKAKAMVAELERQRLKAKAAAGL
jgi:hypothetical protein